MEDIQSRMLVGASGDGFRHECGSSWQTLALSGRVPVATEDSVESAMAITVNQE